MKRSNPSRVLLAAVVAAAGCTGAPTTQPVNQSGYSTAFRQGYAAGCDSVGARRPQRDEARYKTDTDYMMGWNDGYSACQRR
jgi:predicted secreted Zn-dependent protease